VGKPASLSPPQSTARTTAPVAVASNTAAFSNSSDSSSDSSSDDEILDEDWLAQPEPPVTSSLDRHQNGSSSSSTASSSTEAAEDYTSNEFFDQFPPQHRLQLINALDDHVYNDGDAIVTQGDTGTTFFVIKKGEAVITVDENTSGEREITHIYTGQFFGETALIYGSLRQATVRAVGQCVCGVLNQQKFEELVEVRAFLLLQKCDVIRSLTPEEQLRIVAKLRPLEFQQGEQIIRQGDDVSLEDDGLFIITKGELSVVDNVRGRLASIYRGHSFGEMALLNDAPRTASVVATTKTFLLALRKSDFIQICKDSEARSTQAGR
jgi:CRP-like cAMP-binding protein